MHNSFSAIFGYNPYLVADKIKQNASESSRVPIREIPSRTVAYKGYSEMIKSQRRPPLKQPCKRIPRYTEN